MRTIVNATKTGGVLTVEVCQNQVGGVCQHERVDWTEGGGLVGKGPSLSPVVEHKVVDAHEFLTFDAGTKDAEVLAKVFSVEAEVDVPSLIGKTQVGA